MPLSAVFDYSINRYKRAFIFCCGIAFFKNNVYRFLSYIAYKNLFISAFSFALKEVFDYEIYDTNI